MHREQTTRNDRSSRPRAAWSPVGTALIVACTLSVVALGIGPPGASAATTVEAITATGRAPAATRGFPSVVVFTAGGIDAGPVPAEPAVLDQVDKTFVPGVVVARLGQEVEFHNSEDVLHNVHVFSYETDETTLNVAMPPVRRTFLYRPENPGVYAVLCDLHPEMEAYIVVVDNAFATVANEDGTFAIDGLPSGTYDVRVWNVDEDRTIERKVAVGGSQAEIDLSD